MKDNIISFFLDPCGCCEDKDIIWENKIVSNSEDKDIIWENEFVSNTFVISSKNLKIRQELKNNIKGAIETLNNIILERSDNVNKIYVTIFEESFETGVLGRAGPDTSIFQTPENSKLPKIATSGEILFNMLYDPASEEVIIHELMHILGLGFWEESDPFGANYSVIYPDSENKNKPWYYLEDSKAIEAYQTLIFETLSHSVHGPILIANMGETWVDYNGVPFYQTTTQTIEDRVKNTFTAIPIEDNGGTGTALGHFEEGFIGGEDTHNSGINSRNIRMKKGGTPRDPIEDGDDTVVIFYPSLTEEISTGIDDRSYTKFSIVMCGVLADLGYKVDTSNSDSFYLTG